MPGDRLRVPGLHMTLEKGLCSLCHVCTPLGPSPCHLNEGKVGVTECLSTVLPKPSKSEGLVYLVLKFKIFIANLRVLLSFLAMA